MGLCRFGKFWAVVYTIAIKENIGQIKKLCKLNLVCQFKNQDL